MWQKRPTYTAKETCICGKRDLHMWQKRPAYVAKETYMCGKRPTYAAKETCICGKRDLEMISSLFSFFLIMWHKKKKKKRPGDDELHAERVLACARLLPALYPCAYVDVLLSYVTSSFILSHHHSYCHIIIHTQ